ncbi:hypothetical protein BS47DRAFT_1390102 [Hydnum rufescens UP504]|uniref:Uncharacterized protein n=1 Tax=Hydnum rufescens UP504 TaxID=1448309 RepID=A0A9P6B3H3_9AGAM|nr:hypothetical protein BS47DRAFT_1390102 [Hydnum rufescens UP504]
MDAHSHSRPNQSLPSTLSLATLILKPSPIKSQEAGLPLANDYRDDTATVESTSALSSPIVLKVPITPRTTYPMIQTPPNSTQGPHMGNPPSTMSTSSTKTMLLRMLQQMQADLAHSTQIQAEMARTNAQMNARLEELANEN